MTVFKNKSRARILPLSCNPELDQRNITGISAYYSDLNDAFKNPRIRNIAITGQHGVGKSSLIKTFDAKHRSVFRRDPRFLYVSLGQYENVKSDNTPTVSPKTVNTCKVTNDTKEIQMSLDIPELSKKREAIEDTHVQGNTDEQNAIERRMLLQICAKFNDRDFPASSFRLIPRQPGKFTTFGFVLYAMSILLLLIKKPLADMLNSWTPQQNLTADIIGFLLEWHEYIEASLYGIILIGTVGLLCKCFKWISIRGKESRLALKTSNAEWNLGEYTCEDYLDQYTQELVYCLSRVNRKIDRTVVFEDMDRLDKNICIHIFTRLREINHILNVHMKPGEYVRFIFVIDDEIANSLSYDKFFDFIMPVFPTLNRSSAEVIFREYLIKVNSDLECAMKQEQLCYQTGILGAKMITYLDKHPLLKTSCCHFRNCCKWIKKKIFTFIQRQRFNCIRTVLSYLTNAVGKLFSIICKGINKINDVLKKCPAFRYLFSWIAKRHSNIQKWVEKQKNLLVYTEPQRDCYTCDKHTSKCFNCIRKLEEETDGIVQMAAECLTDYRMLFTILNEYSLMMRLYHSNNKSNVTCKAAEHILSFQVYKHLWPQDYQKLLDGKEKGSVLTGKSMDDFTGANKNLLQKLVDNKLLSINSLYYAGFCRSKVSEIWKARLKDGNAKTTIESMDPTNSDHQKLVQEHCRIMQNEHDSITEEILLAAINFALKDNSATKTENDWFFDGRDRDKCLRVMVALEEAECEWFTEQCKIRTNSDIFHKCKNDSFRQGEWTERMAEVYVAGVPHAKIAGISIILKGESEYRNMESFVKK